VVFVQIDNDNDYLLSFLNTVLNSNPFVHEHFHIFEHLCLLLVNVDPYSAILDNLQSHFASFIEPLCSSQSFPSQFPTLLPENVRLLPVEPSASGCKVQFSNGSFDDIFNLSWRRGNGSFEENLKCYEYII